jgi:hypothetical protein
MANSPASNDVPAGHHVARYCHPQRGVVRDPGSREIVGLWPASFELRTKKNPPETYLSLNHFEHFPGDLAVQYRDILAVMRSKFKNPPEPVIARLSASKIIECGTGKLRLRKRSTKRDPSYVALEGLPLDNSDKILLAELAEKTCVEVKTAGQIERAA